MSRPWRPSLSEHAFEALRKRGVKSQKKKKERRKMERKKALPSFCAFREGPRGGWVADYTIVSLPF